MPAIELQSLLRPRWARQAKEGEIVDVPQDENSPYQEVRVAVPNTDDPSLPQNTIRMWVLSFFFLTVSTLVNTLFSLHSPPFSLPGILCAMAAWPMGRAWDRFVPNWKVWGIPLNPGPFNIKEHALLTIMISSVTASYGADVSMCLNLFYKWPGYNLGFQILLSLSTQCIGLSMAGLFKRILVYPAAMIWPENLVTVTFLTNIHRKWNHVADGWKITRLSFFCWTAGLCCIYTIFPQYLAPFLSDFDFPAWIAPSNPVINLVFGILSGLGPFPITFDWNNLSGWFGSPLVPPTRVFVNTGLCLVVFVWVLAAAVHFSNVWYGDWIPLVSANVYDRYQQIYDVSKVMGENGLFNTKKYEAYSPLYIPTTFAVSYGLSFAATTATVTHSLLFDFGRYVRYWNHSGGSFREQDVHMRLMRRSYRETPIWWYATLFAICVALMVAVVTKFPRTGNVGYIFLAIGIALVYTVPVGFIHAVSTITVGLNVVSELWAGYLSVGNPLSMMLFKTYTYYTVLIAIQCLVNMKLGHYVKLSPRLLFFVQLVGVAWGGVLQILFIELLQTSMPDLCQSSQSLDYTCPSTNVFYTASVIWGVIGPQRMFKLYKPLLNFFWIGALCPALSWLLLRYRPQSNVKYIHWPVFFDAMGYMPPATPYVYGCWVFTGLIFSYWIRRYWFNWWAKYNYTLSAGLDLGLAAAQIIILIVGMTVSGAPRWWGTVGCYLTRDGQHMPLKELKKGQSFGLSKW